MHHTIARNAADGGYTKKFVARNVAEVGRDSTAAILRAILRATNFGVDTRCNSAIAPCIRTFRGMSPLSSQELEDYGRENVVLLKLINPSFQQSLTKALEKMIEAKLQFDKFGFNSSNTTKMTGDKIF